MSRKVAIAIGAHPDDIEFFMAGTLLLLKERRLGPVVPATISMGLRYVPLFLSSPRGTPQKPGE